MQYILFTPKVLLDLVELFAHDLTALNNISHYLPKLITNKILKSFLVNDSILLKNWVVYRQIRGVVYGLEHGYGIQEFSRNIYDRFSEIISTQDSWSQKNEDEFYAHYPQIRLARDESYTS